MGTFSPYEFPGLQTGPDGRRYPQGAGPDAFAPRYLCLAYMKFGSAGILARHAYFPMPANPPALAGFEFSSVAAGGRWATTPIRSEVNFENFTFGSQQLIVFHIDPGGAPVRFDPDNFVQFAEWIGQGPKTPATRKARNNSFLNPEIRSWSGIDVLTLENWFVDDSGQPIAPPLEFSYAMNVHLRMRCRLAGADDTAPELPLVLDPDTGNGAGNEP
jgi:hypothetical protein